MTVFEALLMAHLIGDWILQTEYQALNKMKGKFFNWALSNHCVVYPAWFVPAFWCFEISWSLLSLIFSSHMFLDSRWPVVWWINKVKLTDMKTIEALFWLVIAVDQVMHILIFVPIAVLK